MSDIKPATVAHQRPETTAVYLYRFWDSDGVLLYVGITDDIQKRWSTHSKTQPWWGRVSRKGFQQYETREEAAAAESTAIRIERPLYNIQGNPLALPGGERDLESALVAGYGNLVSFPQAAKITSTSVRTMKRLAERGEIRVYRIGRTRVYRLRTADVAQLLQRVA